MLRPTKSTKVFNPEILGYNYGICMIRLQIHVHVSATMYLV